MNFLPIFFQNRALLLDAFTNSLDLFLPLHYLSYLPLPDWAVGAIGAVSSVAAAAPIIDPSLKVQPPN